MKSFLMAALALTFVACSNDDNIIQTSDKPAKADGITITATLAPKDAGATTRAVREGTDEIVVEWTVDEHIAILYNKDGAQMADARIKSVDASGTATIEFSVVTGTADDTACTLVYPYSAAKDDKSGVKDAATLLAAQDGTLSANLDVRVGAGTIKTSTPSLDVTTQPAAQFAIFKFTVKNSDASATINVKPLVVTIATQDYVITPASATSTLYAALPPVNSQTVSFSVSGSDNKAYTCSKDGVTFAAAKYYQSTLKMAEISGALGGLFSVSDSKKVFFSKGNLQATYNGSAWSWAFAENQWGYIGNAAGNTSINGNGSVSANNVTVDLFGWVGASSTTLASSPAQYGISNSSTNDDYGNVSGENLKSDWGTTMVTGWSTLTSAEWTYLFSTRSASTVGSTDNARYAKAKVNDVQGVILFPDTYAHPSDVAAPTGINETGEAGWNGNTYDATAWGKMEAAGCVFLPAAGGRYQSVVSNAGKYGMYWSGPASGTGTAYNVYFGSSSLRPANNGSRCSGYSVRLVRPAE